MNNQSRQALWLALAGSIVLMIAGLWALCLHLACCQLMLNEGLLTLHEGNLAASANYAGYLVGALLLARCSLGRHPTEYYLRRCRPSPAPGAAGLVSSPWTIIAASAPSPVR